MNNLEKNNSRVLSDSNEKILKLMEALPANCTCPICVITKQMIKDNLGENKYLSSMNSLRKNPAI